MRCSDYISTESNHIVLNSSRQCDLMTHIQQDYCSIYKAHLSYCSCYQLTVFCKKERHIYPLIPNIYHVPHYFDKCLMDMGPGEA